MFKADIMKETSDAQKPLMVAAGVLFGLAMLAEAITTVVAPENAVNAEFNPIGPAIFGAATYVLGNIANTSGAIMNNAICTVQERLKL